MHGITDRSPGLNLTGQASPHHRGRTAAIAFITGVALAVALPGCDGSMGGDEAHSINGSVHVSAGKPTGSAGTVNGSIRIDDNAAVTGAATVNGSIHLGAHAAAESLKTVNGGITLDKGAHVAHDVESVNGAISLNDEAEVSGAVANVDGEIVLTAAHVAGGIRTVNGGIKIMGESHVEGGILVKKPSGSWIHLGTDVLRVVIGPGAVVQGELRFEREVRFYVSDRATIGTVTGATAVPFTGDTPPG